jgi:hypothetical protein
VKIAWAINPATALHLRSRFFSYRKAIDKELRKNSQNLEIFVSNEHESLFLLEKIEKYGIKDHQLRVNFVLVISSF